MSDKSSPDGKPTRNNQKPVTFSLGYDSDEELDRTNSDLITTTPTTPQTPILNNRLVTPPIETSNLKTSPFFPEIPHPVRPGLPRSRSAPKVPSPLLKIDDENQNQVENVNSREERGKEATVIEMDPVRGEAVRLVRNATKKTNGVSKDSNGMKRGILANLLQLQNNNRTNSNSRPIPPPPTSPTSSPDVIKPNRRSFLSPNLSSQSLQAFFGFPSSRSSMSDDGYSTSTTHLNERRVAAAIEAILKRQKFLKDLCHAFISYGAPSHRLESNMKMVSHILNVDASFASLPGLMLICFNDQETHTSETVLLRATPGYDMYKLDRVVQIYQKIVKEDLNLDEADNQLQIVLTSPPLYPPWVELLSYGVGSFGSASMLFGGHWLDSAVAGGLGLLVGLMTLLSRVFSTYSNLFELSTSVLISFIAMSIHDYVNYWPVVLSATVNLLPGLSLTVAVMDLASKNMVSGAVRMFYALIAAFILGFGLSLGKSLYEVIFKTGILDVSTVPEALPIYYRLLLFIPVSIAFNIYLLAHPRQWPSMMLIGAIGFLGSHYLPYLIKHEDVVPTIAALTVGIGSNLYARLTSTLPIVPLLGSILLLVPGSLSVRGSAALLDSDSNSGTVLATRMIVTALSITVGLFASTMVVFPMGRKRSAFMSF